MRRRNLFFVILFSVVYLHSTISILSQSQESNLTARPFTNLTFEIDVPPQTILPLQPIPLIIRQKNMTNEKVLGYKSIGMNKMPFYLQIKKGGSNQSKTMGDFSQMFAYGSHVNVEIPPNSVIEAKEWLTLGLNVYFPEPGTYEVKAIIRNENRTQFVESNAINIEIQEPTGTDVNVYNLIKTSRFPESLFGGDYFDKTRNTLENISTRFSTSGYSKNAAFVLGEKYFIRREYQKALLNLIRLEDDRNFIFAEKVRHYLAEIRRLPREQLDNGTQIPD